MIYIIEGKIPQHRLYTGWKQTQGYQTAGHQLKNVVLQEEKGRDLVYPECYYGNEVIEEGNKNRTQNENQY